MRIQLAQNKNTKFSANKQSSSGNLTKFLPKKNNSATADSKANSSASNQGTGSDGEMDDLDEAKPEPKIEEPPPPTLLQVH